MGVRATAWQKRAGGWCSGAVGRCVLVAVLVAVGLPVEAGAEQASEPAAAAAGRLDLSAGGNTAGHACAVLADDDVRCWGYGASGQLGYGDTSTIGDDETPAAAGPVDLGAGRTAKAVTAGGFHTCAALDDGTVRCWGFGGEGRLGYGGTDSIGDDETPGSVGPVDLGAGRTATAITGGGGHTCAVLDDGTVRCWGFGSDGRLGYGNREAIGDDEAPGSVEPVDLGPGRTAKAITAGESDTCALLDDGTVRCWGLGANGQLGYGDTDTVGENETPGSVGPVKLGAGRTATAITAGAGHTCALLDDGTVRCWGFGGNGRLGYGDTATIGNDETPAAAGPVDLGAGRTAEAISAGDSHTCALLDDGTVLCWGYAAGGRLGYASTQDVGDDEAPGSVGPVDLGAGRTAVAISAGGASTCARLDDGGVRCWGQGAYGRLGYCDQSDVGDDETPGARGPVDLGAGGESCPTPTPTPTPTATASPTATPTPTPTPPDDGVDPLALALRAEKARSRRLRDCLRAAAQRPKRDHKRQRAREVCRKRYGRTPGRVRQVRARALSATKVTLTFAAPGSDGHDPPAARSYLVKQSPRQIREGRDFRRAHPLCRGACRFEVTAVGARISLEVKNLRRGSRYYYAVAARDNVSQRLGPRSATVKVRTGDRTGATDRKRPRLSAELHPKRDGRKPYQFTVTGKLKPSKGVSRVDGCTGQVTVKIMRARKGRDKTISSRRATVRDNCRFTHKKTFGKRRLKRRRGTLKYVVRFQGNDVLKPKRAVLKAKFGHKRSGQAVG